MTEIRANPKRTYALIVGIEKYKDGSLPDVNGPGSDAIEFAKWLSKRGVPKKNIFLCISLLEENQGLLEKLELEFQEATQTNVWNLLTESLHKKEGDLLLIFWVGHGIIDSEERKRRLFFADATINNGQNLYLESLLESIKSTYFQIKTTDKCIKKHKPNLYKTLKIASPTKCHEFLHYIVVNVNSRNCAN